MSENPIRDLSILANFLFFLGFSGFRVIAVVQSRYMSARTMLWLNITGCIAASTILIFSYDITISFIAIFMLGASMSKFFVFGRC